MDSRTIPCPRIHRRLRIHRMTESQQKPFAVCFSGHRPEKLPHGTALHMLQSMLYQEIDAAVADGADTFYCGAAQGIDLDAADYVLSLRQKHPNLRLICAVPYPAHGASLSGAARYRLQAVLNAADAVVHTSGHYHKGCFRVRNQYMIAHSQRLIAVMTDAYSGTGQTVRLAANAGIETRIISLQQNASDPASMQTAQELFCTAE